MLLVLKNTSYWNGSFEHPKHMFKLMGKKMITILCYNICLTGPMVYAKANALIVS